MPRLAHVHQRLPVQKIYFNWKSGKSEKCIFCYPRIESGQPTVCSETCVGRIRYLGVLLYDADRIEEAASTEHETDLYERQCDVFLNPHDPAVIEEALKQGIPHNVIDAAQKSPVYKMAMDWKLALPLHRNIAPCRWSGTCRRCRRFSRYADAGGLPQRRRSACRRKPAHSGAVSGEHAERRRYRPGAARAETHDGDAPLQTLANRRRRDRYPRHRRGGPERSRSRRCTAIWRSPTTKTAS
jgi:nitrate reductase beta subunit